MSSARRALLFACLASGACTAFSCGGAFKGNDATSSDGGDNARDGSTTLAIDGPDAPTFDASTGRNTNDSGNDGSNDAGAFTFPPNTFCGMLGDAAIFCSDFDEDAAAGREWKSSQNPDDLSLVSTFDGGSAPNALAATGAGRLTTPTIPITMYRGHTVVVEIPFYVAGLPPSALAQFLTFGFNGTNGVATGCALNTSVALDCPGAPSVTLTPGAHDIRFLISVLPDGGVPQYATEIDGISYAGVPLPTLNPTLTLYLGNATQNAWVGTYDNIRIYTQ